MHNVACEGDVYQWYTSYALYDEVYWPDESTCCHYYSAMDMNSGNSPSYNTAKGNVTGCNTTGAWVAKGLCTPMMPG